MIDTLDDRNNNISEEVESVFTISTEEKVPSFQMGGEALL
jgi:hypothetical protein